MIDDTKPCVDQSTTLEQNNGSFEEDNHSCLSATTSRRRLERQVGSDTLRQAPAGGALQGAGAQAHDPALDLIDDMAANPEFGDPAIHCRSNAKSVDFIDAGVTDVTAIVRAASTDAEIVMLDEASDGVEQIAAHLAGKTGIRSIQIVSHGDAGELHLGTASLTLGSISGEHAGALCIVRAALAEEADIRVNGCDVAVGENGEAFIGALRAATGADIAVSGDETGAETPAGDRGLKSMVGVLEEMANAAPDAHGNVAPHRLSVTAGPVVRDSVPAIVATGSGGGAIRHLADTTTLSGPTGLWQSVGFAGSTAMDLHAAILSVAGTNPGSGQVRWSNIASSGDGAPVRTDGGAPRIRKNTFRQDGYRFAVRTLSEPEI